MTRSFALRSIGLAALVLGMAASGCSGKRATSSQSSNKPSDQTSSPAPNAVSNQASNALGVTPAAPSPTPMPYPAEVTAPRDPASGLPTGKRMHKPITVVAE